MTITNFDRKTALMVGARIEAALAALAAELGVQIKRGRTTYSGNGLSLKLEVSTIGVGGKVNTKEATAFTQLAGSYGLNPADLGRSFSTGGTTYTISGLNTRARKRPIHTECGSKTYTWPEATVKALLASQAA